MGLLDFRNFWSVEPLGGGAKGNFAIFSKFRFFGSEGSKRVVFGSHRPTTAKGVLDFRDF